MRRTISKPDGLPSSLAIDPTLLSEDPYHGNVDYFRRPAGSIPIAVDPRRRSSSPSARRSQATNEAGACAESSRDSECREPAQAADRRSRELINRRLRDDSLLGFACRPVWLYLRIAKRNRLFSAVYPEEDFGAQYLVVCSPPLDNAGCPLARRPLSVLP